MFKHNSGIETCDNTEISTAIPEDKKSLDSADAQEFVIISTQTDNNITSEVKEISTSETADINLTRRSELCDQDSSIENVLKCYR